MKKILAITGIALGVATASYAQGLVTISATTATVTTNSASNASGNATGNGAYLFELLDSANTSLASTANQIYGNSANFALWTDSTVSGANGFGLNAGKVTASSSATAANWPAAGVSYALSTADSYIIVGWSSSYGANWAAVSSAIQNGTLAAGGYYGVTAIGVSAAGGGPNSLGAPNLWANSATGVPGQGLQTPGLVLNQVVATPEPATMALFALGGASVLLFRRRK
jgi:hypothetical protein